MKDLIIAILVLSVIILGASLKSMTSKACYWMERADNAEEMLDKVKNDKPSYYWDVLSESDSFTSLQELKEMMGE